MSEVETLKQLVRELIKNTQEFDNNSYNGTFCHFCRGSLVNAKTETYDHEPICLLLRSQAALAYLPKQPKLEAGKPIYFNGVTGQFLHPEEER